MNARRLSPPRRAARLLLRLIGGLLALLAVTVAAALIWLRTDAAAAFIAGKAVDALAEQGLFLKAEEFRGPLPGSLHLRGIRLADADGLFFQADRLSVDITLARLLRLSLDIERVELIDAELFRLPAGGREETAEAKTPDKENAASGGIPELPVTIVLGELRIQNAVLHNAVFAAGAATETPPDAAPADTRGPLPQTLSVNATASASLAGSTLSARLDAALAAGNAEDASLSLALTSSPAADDLAVAVTLAETRPGIAALLTGNPDLPSYSLNFSGSGPVDNWTAQARLGVQPPADAPQEEAAELTAALHLRCATGSLWKDLLLHPSFALDLDADLLPGAYAAMMGELGGPVSLRASLNQEGASMTGSARLETAVALFALDNVRLAPGKEGGEQTLHAEVGALLPDAVPRFFPHTGTAAPTSESPDGPLPEAAPRNGILATAVLDALPSDAGIDADIGGRLLADINGEAFALDWELDLSDDGAGLTLAAFRAAGLGLEADASARMRRTPRGLDARSDIRAEDNAPWQRLVSLLLFPDLAASGGPLPVGGDIRLNAALALAPLSERNAPAEQTDVPSAPSAGDSPYADRLSGDITLTARAVRWPADQLAAVLGQDIDAAIRISGGGNAPYLVELDTASAGIFNASGTVGFMPEASPAAPGALPAGTLDARLTLLVSDTAPLAGGTPPALSGPVRITAAAAGPPDALALRLEAASEALRLPDAVLRGLHVAVEAETSLRGSALSAEGTLSGRADAAPGGPLSLAGGWRAGPAPGPENAGLAVALRDLTFQGADAALSADIAALVPQNTDGPGAPPQLDGTVRLRVEDWRGAAALTGIPLRGKNTELALDVRHDAGRQHAALKASVPALTVQERGAESPSLSLRDLTLTVDAADLFGALNARGTIAGGRGIAGPLQWGGSRGELASADGKGTFSLDLSRRKNADPKEARGRVLELRAAFDLPEQVYTVEKFSLGGRGRNTGLALQRPLRITARNGLTVEGLDMAFKPEGRLTADAAFAPGSLSLKAELHALPFSALRLLTDAALPGGSVTAQAELSGAPHAPQGGFSLHTAINDGGSGIISTDGDAALSGNPLDIALQGAFSAAPDPASGLRSQPGILWLNGSGILGSAGKNENSREGRLSFQLPLRPDASGLPLPAGASPFAARFSWDGPVAPLWTAVPLPDLSLSGMGQFDIALSGTPDNPTPSVTAYLAGGRFQDIGSGVLLQNLALEARTEPDGSIPILLSAEDSTGGKAALEAFLDNLLSPAPPAVRLRAQLDGFHPLRRDDLNLSLSGILGVNGPLAEAKVTGTIVVDEGEFNISGNMGGSVPLLETTVRTDDSPAPGAPVPPAPEPDPETAAGPSLDLQIILPHSMHIRGMGLESEWEGKLGINGPASAPSLTGSLRPIRGYLDILSRTFQFTSGNIHFYGGGSVIPSLNLELSHESPAVTAFIRIAGTAQKPKLELSSRPPLPQDEVLAQVLFGKRASELSRFEAIQLADNLRELTGFGGSTLDLLGGARKRTGLDMLRLTGSQGSEQRATSGEAGESNLTGPGGQHESDGGMPAVEAGKYINDSIYVGVEQGFGDEGTAVRVEVELFPSVTLEGRSSSSASEVGVGWKKDY